MVYGWACGRLSNVDLPIRVSRVRNVQPYARKSVGFLAVPRLALAQSEPSSRHQKPLIAVDVESLLRRPPLRTPCSFMFGGRQHISMRQHVTLHFHRTGGT